MHVNSLTSAENVSIVSWRTDTDSLGSATKEVAHVVRELLESIRSLSFESTAEHLVKKNGVMCRASSSYMAV